MANIRSRSQTCRRGGCSRRCRRRCTGRSAGRRPARSRRDEMSDEHVEVQIREPDEQVGWGRLLIRFAMVLVVLVIGVGIMLALLSSGPEAKKKDDPRLAPIVQVVTVTTGTQDVAVTASGTVVP